MRRRTTRSRSVSAWIESLEPKSLLSATVIQSGNIGYFASPSAPQVQRYDTVNETWLSPVVLSGASQAPTVIHVDSDGIYAAFGKTVYRYQMDGTNPVHLINAQYNINAIHSDGNLLFLNDSSGLYARFLSINKTTNQLIDSFENYVSSVYGSSISTTANRIIGRSQGISPADITFVSYGDNGHFTGGGDSPYHGDYPDASTTWMFPGGSKVVDDSGAIYSVSSLTHLNSFGSAVNDVAFLGSDVPIVLSGNKLTAFSSAILPSGSVQLGYTPTNIFVNSTHVMTFRADAAVSTGFRVDLVNLSALNPPTPGQPVNPVGLNYTPDKIETLSDGKALILSKAQQSLFVWNPQTQSYSQSIPLVDVPSYMAYSATTNTAYLAYPSGLIRKLDMSAATPAEVPFATLPQAPLGLSTAGQYLFAVDGSGAWDTHYTYGPDGTLVDSVDWNYYSTEYVWNDTNQKMYFFRDDTSPNDLLYEEINANGSAYAGEPAGGIRGGIDSPLHGAPGFDHPIRVAPDGSIVVLGSGFVHDAKTLARKSSSLGNSISDATWIGNDLFTIRTIAGVAQLQQWSQPTFAMTKSVQTTGTANRLVSLPGDKLLAITMSGSGTPTFTVFDRNLNVVAVPPMSTSVFSLSATSVSGIEGNDGSTNLTLTVTRAQDLNSSASVDYAVTGRGTSPADAADFGGSLPSGRLTFAAGETEKTISIGVRGDFDFETDEGFLVTLSHQTTGATIATTSAEGTILNDDFQLQKFAASGGSVLSVSVLNGRLQVMIDSVLQTEIEPALIGALKIEGGDANDSIVLTGLSRQLYPNLLRIGISGGGGNDTILGSSFNETIQGGMGDDSVSGGGGLDIFAEQLTSAGTFKVATTAIRTQFVLTGVGTDTISDIEELGLLGSDGNDRIDARRFRGNVTLLGGNGNDTLIGGSYDDSLDGGAGNDRLTGNGGTNQLIGGKGTDYVIEAGSDNFVLTPTSLTGLGTTSLSSIERADLRTAETNSLIDATAFLGPVTLTGGAGNDTLLAGSGRDLLRGGAGNDLLNGGAGNDSLTGQAGNDTLVDVLGNNVLSGGDGDDSLIGGSGHSTLIGGNGKDLVMGGGRQTTGLGGTGSSARSGAGQKDPGDLLLNVELINETFGSHFDWE